MAFKAAPILRPVTSYIARLRRRPGLATPNQGTNSKTDLMGPNSDSLGMRRIRVTTASTVDRDVENPNLTDRAKKDAVQQPSSRSLELLSTFCVPARSPWARAGSLEAARLRPGTSMRVIRSRPGGAALDEGSRPEGPRKPDAGDTQPRRGPIYGTSGPSAGCVPVQRNGK